MKKLIRLICTGVLVGVLGAGCAKNGGEPAPEWACWGIFSTIPNQETILLAKSGLSGHEAHVISDDFKKQYGEKNVMDMCKYPIDGYNIDGQEYRIVHPEAVPDCYEITMTIDFSGKSVPTIRDLLGYGFRAVRINGSTAICRRYEWAFTKEGAEGLIHICEHSYNYYKEHYGNGSIIGNTSIKCLGNEVHNKRIEF